MRAVDDVVLSLLRTETGLDVHDGEAIPDRPVAGQPAVVTYDVPYLVFYSSIGDDDNPRLSARDMRRSVFFQLTYVGLNRWQAKGAGERARTTLQRRRLTIPAYPQTWPCKLQESQRVRRDDDAIRPDGSPLFYGVDNYAVSIMLRVAA